MAHVLVTGANRGIGLEFVRQCLADGDRVVATCRQPGRAHDLTRLAAAHPGHLSVLPLRLPDARSIAELVHELDVLDVRVHTLINNAGHLVDGERFGHVGGDALADTFATNAAGPFLLTQALAQRLVDGARVVNVSSRLGSIESTTSLYSPSYAISKAALNMATRLLAIALAPRAIAVVAMSPGWVRTDMGGASAPTLVDAAVAAMRATLARIGIADSGSFLGADGTTIPW
jgi:NAD(P)-dependent dehydrogenase (short-subunit alcohol dehydrogenase family)